MECRVFMASLNPLGFQSSRYDAQRDDMQHIYSIYIYVSFDECNVYNHMYI